jgi:hypothetical protein
MNENIINEEFHLGKNINVGWEKLLDFSIIKIAFLYTLFDEW